MDKDIKKYRTSLIAIFATVLAVSFLVFILLYSNTQGNLLYKTTFIFTNTVFVATTLVVILFYLYIGYIKKMDNGVLYNNEKTEKKNLLPMVSLVLFEIVSLLTGSIYMSIVVLLLAFDIINKMLKSKLVIGDKYITVGFKSIFICSFKELKENDNGRLFLEFVDRKPININLDRKHKEFIDIIIEQKCLMDNLCLKYGVKE
ncbi:MAG: hypothetical protein ACERKV_02050 [Clostridiaceae bacterium]